MLEQATHWLDVAGSAIDGLLLLRVLQLRLYRVYVFITLACALALFFDVVSLWLGSDSPENLRTFLYSRFLYAFLFPLVSWDVFEEIKDQVRNLRRLAMGRLISGLVLTIVLGLLIAGSADSSDSSGPSLMTTLAVVLWAGASTASLAFLITLHRVLRTQALDRPNNTSVWLRYFELALLAEVMNCFSSLLLTFSKGSQGIGIANVLLLSYGITITVWCSLKLRGIPSDVSPAPEKAGL